MASATVAELLDYVRTGLKLLGLKTYIEMEVVHQRDTPWSLHRSGDKELQLWCHCPVTLDEVVATVQGWGHTVKLAKPTGTVIITPALN